MEWAGSEAEEEGSEEAKRLQNYTSAGLGSVIVKAVDSDAAGPSVRSANKAEVPDVGDDRGVDKAKTGALVGSDNVAGGALGAASPRHRRRRGPRRCRRGQPDVCSTGIRRR